MKGKRHIQNVYPPPPHYMGCPHVALKSATLRGYRMTLVILLKALFAHLSQVENLLAQCLKLNIIYQRDKM
jgi:hypothetical protein